ncbi:DUF190 domain-containing protein [Mycolicibacterium baixiangningiae]|uniref:DUF190 domain-containing protein n=1 Tax=Mycolicibacterium baixiangningiae TaxID=2761578 RepID=UPI0018D1C93C|nr:DUF190 domain-containing protein [Mycolicibacterium baixiangningiae]
MSGDLAKSTAYFGERQRSGDRFTADALLDLYTAASVTTSIVIRGIAGFGPRHELRSDLTLTGSEDPPIAVMAVDTAAKMRQLTADTVGLVTRGLVTLESLMPADEPMPAGPSVKVTVYVQRGHRISGALAYVAVCDVLQRHGFHAATAYLGVDGTAGGRRRRATFFGRNVEVPAMVIAIGPRERAVPAIAELRAMPGLQMLTVEAVTTCKVGGRLLSPPPELPRDAGSRQKLTVQTCASALHDGVPIHRALVTRLRGIHQTAGMTVLRAVWGFQNGSAPLADSVFRIGRRVPVTTLVVDTPERIAAGFQVADALTAQHGVVTVEKVPGAVSIDAGVRRGTM